MSSLLSDPSLHLFFPTGIWTKHGHSNDEMFMPLQKCQEPACNYYGGPSCADRTYTYVNMPQWIPMLLSFASRLFCLRNTIMLYKLITPLWRYVTVFLFSVKTKQRLHSEWSSLWRYYAICVKRAKITILNALTFYFVNYSTSTVQQTLPFARYNAYRF